MVALFPVRKGWKPKPRLNGDSIKKRRGRPKKNPEMRTVKPIRLSQDMVENFDQWKLDYGVKTYDEAIRMRLADRSDKIVELRKKEEAQDDQIKSLKEKIEVLNVQQESLKRIEGRQIEAVAELEDTVKQTEKMIEVRC